MIFQLSWVFFIGLLLTGGALYNVAMKIAGEQINIFLFSAILTVVASIGHFLMLAIYKYGFSQGEKLEVSALGIYMGILAGFAVILIDIGFFMGVKTGGIASTQAAFTVGGLIIATIMGFYFFQEGFNVYKAIGILLGLTSLAFLMKQS